MITPSTPPGTEPESQAESDPTDDGVYASMLADVQGFVDGFAPPMRALLEASLEPMRTRAFVRLMALMPVMLSDLVPVAPATAQRLGLANFYAGWYYHAQDDLLDGQAAASDWLVGHLVFNQIIETYRGLDLIHTPVWPEFQSLAHRSANAYAHELRHRVTSLDTLTPEQLAAFDVEFILNRAAPMFFSPLAQLYLAGIPAHAERAQDLLEALRCWAAARQLSDDASDWVDDLKAGQLNAVSARLLEHWTAPPGERTLERLSSFQLTAEDCWSAIEQTSQSLCQRALARLSAYGPCRLQALVVRQQADQTQHWAELRANRLAFRALFGL
jgi:hypothetical protein